MAISGWGSVYGRRWRRASFSVHRSFSKVTGSSRGHQPGDDVDGVLEQVARLGHVEADHRRVARQRARAEPEHEPAAGHVVELHGTLRHPQGVVVAGADHAGAELDRARPLRGGRDEDLGRRDRLAAGRVVLADPGLVEPEPVEVLDELEVAVEQQRRVLTGRMERGHEDAEPHAGHARYLPKVLSCWRRRYKSAPLDAAPRHHAGRGDLRRPGGRARTAGGHPRRRSTTQRGARRRTLRVGRSATSSSTSPRPTRWWWPRRARRPKPPGGQVRRPSTRWWRSRSAPTTPRPPRCWPGSRPRWRASVAALRAADPDRRLSWAAAPLRPATLATTRIAEHWAHGLDITGPLGIDFPDTDRLRHVAWLGHATLPYAFALAGDDPHPVHCELVGPHGDTWRYGPPDADSTVTGAAGAFCRVGARRLAAEDSGLVATGPHAAAALRVLRNYAF